MSRFNLKVDNTTQNLAGGKAFMLVPKMELFFSCATTFLEDKFYQKGDQRIDRIKELCDKVDYPFISKLAVYCRKKLHLRSISHLLVSILAKKHSAMQTIEALAERPDDLTEILALIGRPIPKSVKRGIRHALYKFNRYQLAKYKMEDKKIKLVDVFNLVHPKPQFATEEQKNAWKDLMTGKLKCEDTWESKLSAGQNKKEVWHNLLDEHKLGYMALLRNLRNIEECGDEELIKMACQRLIDEEAIIKSKQLPFRFFTASQQVSNQKVLQAVNKAFEISLKNVPEFEGKTLIAVDGSGSMKGDPLQKAAIFAGCLFKKNDADLIIYADNYKEAKLLSPDSLLSIINGIINNAKGGGTNTGIVFEFATRKSTKYDRIIILSDNESWQYNAQQAYNDYRKLNDCQIFAVDIAGYGTTDLTSPKVFHLAGWNDKIFDLFKLIEDKEKIISIIENYNIEKYARKTTDAESIQDNND